MVYQLTSSPGASYCQPEQEPGDKRTYKGTIEGKIGGKSVSGSIERSDTKGHGPIKGDPTTYTNDTLSNVATFGRGGSRDDSALDAIARANHKCTVPCVEEARKDIQDAIRASTGDSREAYLAARSAFFNKSADCHDDVSGAIRIKTGNDQAEFLRKRSAKCDEQLVKHRADKAEAGRPKTAPGFFSSNT